jgi:hypothetical protein
MAAGEISTASVAAIALLPIVALLVALPASRISRLPRCRSVQAKAHGLLPCGRVESTIMKTLSEAMEGLLRRGFTEHFGVRGDQLRGLESGKTFGPGDVTIREYERFEGVSDPDDMAIIYAIESSTGIRGTLVDAFGVYSDPRISAYLGPVPFAGGAHEAGARAA